jgi:fatty acid desaturase
MIYAQYMQAPTKEVRVSKLIRQTHRWLSIIFTATVIANFVAMALGQPPAWVVYSPLPPLFLMLVTGLYMFVLPYLSKWRAGTEGAARGHESRPSRAGGDAWSA